VIIYLSETVAKSVARIEALDEQRRDL